MAVNSSSITAALGAGSGIDVKALAQGLVEAERQPQKDRIDQKIAKSEARISGYGALMTYLNKFKDSFDKLNDPSDFGALSLANSQPGAFTAKMAAGAVPGSQDISVLQLASAQRSRSADFASATADLTDGSQPLVLQLAKGQGTAREISVGSPASPQAIVDAINLDAQSSNSGLSAKLVPYVRDSAIRYTIELQGASGAEQMFSLGIKPDSFVPADPLQAAPPVLQSSMLSQAADALVSIDGRLVSSSSNSVSDATSKLTLDLAATTTSPARVSVSREMQSTKDAILSMVSDYNDLQEAAKVLADSKSDVETLGGSLAGDRLLDTVRNQLRSVLRGPDAGTTGINRLTDLGIYIDRDGRMKIESGQTPNSTKLDEVLSRDYEGVMRMFSGNPAVADKKKGLADNMLSTLSTIAGTAGLVDVQSKAVARDVRKYKDQLETLEMRMGKLLERYTKQFSIMETLVGSSKDTKNGLASTFEGMSSAYNNN